MQSVVCFKQSAIRDRNRLAPAAGRGDGPVAIPEYGNVRTNNRKPRSSVSGRDGRRVRRDDRSETLEF